MWLRDAARDRLRAKLAKRHASESSCDDTPASAQNPNIAPQHEGDNKKRKRGDSETDDLPAGLPEAIPRKEAAYSAEMETAKKSKTSKRSKKKAKMKRRACKKCDMGVNGV
jgi:hypothetical protein